MESLFVMAQVAPTEYPKDNLEKADSLVSNGVQGVQTRLKRKDRFESK